MKHLFYFLALLFPIFLQAQLIPKRTINTDDLVVRGIKINGAMIDSVSTDTTFSSTNHQQIPTTQAVETYIGNRLVDARQITSASPPVSPQGYDRLKFFVPEEDSTFMYYNPRTERFTRLDDQLVYNVLDWGLKGDGLTDDTDSLRTLVEFLMARNGGTIYFPPTPAGYNIRSVNLTTGIYFLGGGYGEGQNGDRGYTQINIVDDGMGFILGELEYFPTIRSSGMLISNFKINGNPNARSGIRIGSDSSFITPKDIRIENVSITGFTNDTVSQLIYDKTTPELGSLDNNYPGTFPFRGACGIFIAGGIDVQIRNLQVENSRYCVGESAGGFVTTFTWLSCYFRTSDIGVKLYTAKDFTFTDCTIFESLDSAALEVIIPETSNLNLQIGPIDIRFDNVHVENTNVNDPLGYCFKVINKNESVETRSWLWENCSLSFREQGWFFDNVDQFILVKNGTPILSAGDTLIRCENINYVEYTGYVNENYRFGWHKNLKLYPTREEAQGVVAYNAGGVAAEYRAAGTNDTDTLEQGIIVGGDLVIWNQQNKHYVNPFDKGVLKVFAWGSFSADDDQKRVRLKIDGTEVMSNAIITNPNASTWYCEIELMRTSSSAARYVSKLYIGSQIEPIRTGILSGSDWWDSEKRLYITGQNAVPTLNGVSFGGAHAEYYSIID